MIHFIRLGVLQRITEMVNESEEMEIDEIIEGKMAKKVLFQTTISYSFLFLVVVIQKFLGRIHCNVTYSRYGGVYAEADICKVVEGSE